jgi:hypothetical protein
MTQTCAVQESALLLNKDMLRLVFLVSHPEAERRNVCYAGLDIKCPPKVHVLKAWSPMQCSEVGFWESDWILRTLTGSSTDDVKCGRWNVIEGSGSLGE